MPCPVALEAGEDHGPLLPSKDPSRGWFCPNAVHDGRLHGHPQGPAPATRRSFTTAEVEEAKARALVPA